MIFSKDLETFEDLSPLDSSIILVDESLGLI